MSVHEVPQLDLFEHSQDVMLCNDAIDAVLARDAAATTRAQTALAGLDPRHAALRELPVLIAALTPTDARPFDDGRAATAARLQLQQVTEPAARVLLGPGAQAWLAPLWRSLADRAAALPFDPAQPDSHPAALWLQAGEPAAAERAVQRIASWRRLPPPLSWMVRARHAQAQLDAVWPLLIELAWLAPASFAACTPTLDDPLLNRLLHRFDAGYEEAGPADGLAWFPAWLLNDQPALLPHLRLAEPSRHCDAERGFRLIAELLGLERQGRHAELIERRKRLRDLQPALYRSYMQTR